MFYICFGVTCDVENVKRERFVFLPISVSVYSANSCSSCLIKWLYTSMCVIVDVYEEEKKKKKFEKYTTIGAPKQTNIEVGRELG